MENRCNIITLGASGSGKTVFLASLFNEFSVGTDEGIHLEVQDPRQEKELITIFAEVAHKKSWPRGTRISDGITEWDFTCYVKTPDLHPYKACHFNYIDFAGGIITDIIDNEDDQAMARLLDERISSANAFWRAHDTHPGTRDVPSSQNAPTATER